MANPKVGTFIFRRNDFGRFYYIKIVDENLTETLYYAPPQYLWGCSTIYTYGDNVNFYVRKRASPKEMVEMIDHPYKVSQYIETISNSDCNYKLRKLLETKETIVKESVGLWKKISESSTLSNEDIFTLIEKLDTSDNPLKFN